MHVSFKVNSGFIPQTPGCVPDRGEIPRQLSSLNRLVCRVNFGEIPCSVFVLHFSSSLLFAVASDIGEKWEMESGHAWKDTGWLLSDIQMKQHLMTDFGLLYQNTRHMHH
jgi:hypothetical protein